MIGLAVLAVAGGGYWYYTTQTASGAAKKDVLKAAAQDAAHGDVDTAAQKVRLALPEINSTLVSIFGKDVADGITKSLQTLHDVESSIQKSLRTDTPQYQQLRSRAKELEDEIRKILSDAVDIQKRALKELGPTAKGHYEAVKMAVTPAPGGSIVEAMENGMKSLKEETKKFYHEAMSSNVGEEVREKIRAIAAKTEELKQNASKAVEESKKR